MKIDREEVRRVVDDSLQEVAEAARRAGGVTVLHPALSTAIFVVFALTEMANLADREK